MTKNIFKITATILIGSVLLSACKKNFFYQGVNNDPGSVTQSQLPPTVLLNGAELSIGYTVGGDISRYTSLFVNSVQGVNRQFASYQNYTFSAQDFGTPWAIIYQQGLNNLIGLKNIAIAQGYPQYQGVANVLMAYEFGLTTDLWGDIPYTTALQGNIGNVKPTYDKQSAIYVNLQVTLDSALAQLARGNGGKAVGADDFIFNGSIPKWIAFANALKARYYLHLSKTDNAYATKVLTSINAALAGSAVSAQVPFFNNETQANPWYQYLEQRGDISYANSFLATTLKSKNDPRFGAYIDATADGLTSLYAGIAAPVTLLSKTEMLFIKTEALSAIADPTAATFYNAAITSSFSDAGVAIPAGYLAVNALTGATHASRLPQIMLQKYLALFTQAESFNDWRRTGYPVLKPNNGPSIPRRFLYPQTELDYNGPNVPTGTTLFSKVGWDL